MERRKYEKVERERNKKEEKKEEEEERVERRKLKQMVYETKSLSQSIAQPTQTQSFSKSMAPQPELDCLLSSITAAPVQHRVSRAAPSPQSQGPVMHAPQKMAYAMSAPHPTAYPPPLSSAAAPSGPSSGKQQQVGKADAKLDKILLSQNADGTWSLTDVLCGLLQLTVAAVKASKPSTVDESLWMTAIVVAFLESTYATFRDEWDLIVDKSLAVFRSKNAPSDLVALAKAFIITNKTV